MLASTLQEPYHRVRALAVAAFLVGRCRPNNDPAPVNTDLQAGGLRYSGPMI